MKKRLTVLLLILLVAINCMIVVPVSAFAQSEETCENHVHSQADIASATASDSYQLQYNTWDGEWTDDYLYYNGYAFALGRTDNFYNQGMLSGYNRNVIVDHKERYGEYEVAILKNVSKLQEYVYEDLQHLGYNCIKVTRHGYNIPLSGVNLICLRNGHGKVLMDYDPTITKDFDNVDFHFMKYQGGEWYHKPGNTAILKYNGMPQPSEPWVGEYVWNYNNNLDIGESSYVYDGDMYFFAFQQDCKIMTRYYNTSTHRTGCINCYKDEIFEPHTMVQEKFWRICTVCGYMIKKNGEIVTPWNNDDLI